MSNRTGLMLAAFSAAFMFDPVRAGVAYDGSSRGASYAGNAEARPSDATLNRLEQTKEALDNGVSFDKAAVAREEPAVRETIRGYLNGQGHQGVRVTLEKKRLRNR